jgi:uncharacterized tellurite resistance protein B-like protein
MGMKFLDHFDHSERKQGKEHFIHLVQVAKADGKVDERELAMLNRIGSKFGLTEPEIKELLLVDKSSDYIPPYELSKRFEQVYDIMRIVCADKKIDESELDLVKSLALKSGFNETEIPLLTTVLIEGIKKGEDEEDLFTLYKKKRMGR